MSGDEAQSFHTGPSMLHPWLAVVLAAGCGTLAGTQWWIATRQLPRAGFEISGEVAARALFASVFTVAAFGIVIALLERRRAAVLLSDTGITIRSWRGTERAVPWREVEAVDLIVPEGNDPELRFHWLTLRARDVEIVRLAGGPWPESVEVRRLRRAIVNRLDLLEDEPRRLRLALVLPAQRRRWS